MTVEITCYTADLKEYLLINTLLQKSDSAGGTIKITFTAVLYFEPHREAHSRAKDKLSYNSRPNLLGHVVNLAMESAVMVVKKGPSDAAPFTAGTSAV